MEPKEQIRLIKENTADIVREEELLERIKKKGCLRVKFGVDPTTTDIHLGHSVPLSKLRCFQDLGHEVVLLIGDFTARIGDPSGRTKTRKPLSPEQINANAKTYKEQAFKILDPHKTKIDYNSRWLGKMDFSQVLKLSSHYTVARMLERDDLQENGYTEDLPSMQGVGYRQIVGYLNGDYSLEEAARLVKRDTRRLAKRQLNWFNRDHRIIWIQREQYPSREDVSRKIIEILLKKLPQTKKSVII